MRNSPPELLGAGEIFPDPGWHLAPHLHPFHEIIVVTAGVLHLQIGAERIDAAAGDVLFYRAGRVHEEWSDRKSPVATCFLSLSAASLPELPTRVPDAGGRIRQLVAWILQDHRYRLTAHLPSRLAEVLLLQLERLSLPQESPWLLSLRRRMQENLGEDLDLDTVAAWAGMSKFAFVRKYKRVSGGTPMRDLRQMRLDHGRSLLLTTNMPIKCIAEASHLGDESQFSKLFHRVYKLWPSEVRVDS